MIITIDELKEKIKDLIKAEENQEEQEKKYNKIKENLLKKINDLDNINNQEIVKGLVKAVKSEDENWKFYGWYDTYGKPEWDNEFAKNFIELCKTLFEADTFDSVKDSLKYFTGIDNRTVKASAFSISPILHCIQPYYIPILRTPLKDPTNHHIYDIYDICYILCDKDEKPTGKASISNFLNNIEKIHKFCNKICNKRFHNMKNENRFNFALIDDKLREWNLEIPKEGNFANSENTVLKEGDKKMVEVKEIEFDKNMILFGPPGTGKTYNTVIYAVAICDGLKENDTDNDEIKKVKEILVKHFVGEEYKKLLASKEIQGKHFDGKSNITKDEYKKLLARYNTLKDPKESGRIAFTTFHQSYGYEEFIEGIKPVMENGQNSADSNANEDAKETNNEADNKSKDVKYEIKSGVFKSFCDVAKKDPDNSYVFIIDEINRGNISKIFGELITLIEPTKRTGEAEAMEAILPYSNEPFGVPKNVYIIGTMNTADRSIALMDTALRRRFQFVEMLPDPEVLKGIKINNTIDVKQLLTDINERIEYLYDREHTIGHAFFTCLLNEEKRNVKELGKIFEKSVIPLLQEYFYDDYKKIMLVLGYDPKPNDNNKTNQSPNKQEYKKPDQLIIATKLEKSSIFKGDTSDIDIPEYSYEIVKDAFDNIESYTKICNENKNNSKQENRLV